MSNTRIPTSTSVSESAVIEAPFSAVWHLIKLQEFSSFWSKLEKSEVVKSASPETDIVKWTFKDGTVLDVKQEEHSVRFFICPLSHVYSFVFCGLAPLLGGKLALMRWIRRASTTSSLTRLSRPSRL
jgi:hypothetical protein